MCQLTVLIELSLYMLVAISIVLPKGIGPDFNALPLRGISGAGGVIKAGVRGEPGSTIFS